MNCTEAQTSILVSGKYSCIDAPWKCPLKYPQAGTDLTWTVDTVTKLCAIVPSPSPSPINLPFTNSSINNSTNTTINSTGLTCLTGYKKLCTSPPFAGLTGSCICVPFDSSVDNTTQQPYVDENTRTAKEGVNCENPFYCFFTDTLPYALISVFSAALFLGCVFYCLHRYCCPGWNPCRTCCYRCRGCRGTPPGCCRRNGKSPNSSCCCSAFSDHSSSSSRHRSGHHHHKRNTSYPIEKHDPSLYRNRTKKYDDYTKQKKYQSSDQKNTKGSSVNFKPSLDMESTDTLSLAEILTRALNDHSYAPNKLPPHHQHHPEPIILQLPSTKDGKYSPRYVPMSPWRDNPLYGTLPNGKSLHDSLSKSFTIPEPLSSTLSVFDPSQSMQVSLRNPIHVYRENLQQSQQVANRKVQPHRRSVSQSSVNVSSLPPNNEALIQTLLSLKTSIKNKTLTPHDIEQILRQTLPPNNAKEDSSRSSYSETDRSNDHESRIRSGTNDDNRSEITNDSRLDIPVTPRYVTEVYDIPHHQPNPYDPHSHNYPSGSSLPYYRSNHTISPSSSAASNHGYPAQPSGHPKPHHYHHHHRRGSV